MIPRAVVIGLGQPAAGDDGVGIAVIVRLRAEGIIVDALVGGGKPGDVVVLDAERLAGDLRPLSTHGISVAQAIVLARALAPAAVSPIVRVVGIVIAIAEVGDAAFSPAIAAAVPKACAKVHELIREVMN